MEKIKESKHNIIKVIIAVVIIPLVTILMSRIVGDHRNTDLLHLLIGFAISYASVSLYDFFILKEPKKTIELIAENSTDIKLIKEDVRGLQESVYREEMYAIRERNAERAFRRDKGLKETFAGDSNARKKT